MSNMKESEQKNGVVKSESSKKRSALDKRQSSGSSESVYIKVIDEESDDPIEIPAENDGLLLLSTLSAQFPGACGLKFKSSSGAFRGLRLDDAGRIHPPSADEGWGDRSYVAVFPKENTKRKMDDHVDASGATKLKRIERKKCTDLIVLGLPFKTTEDELREYFEQFGELLVSQIKRDAKSGQSKGYGFIRYADYDSQLKALSQRHNIDGRMCDAKIPNSKESSNPSSRKIFVGRINDTMTHEDLKEHFNQFGEVTDVFIPKPFRGFAFVSFTDSEVAESLCGEDYIIKGCSVHVSQAVPKENHSGASSRGGGAAGPMSRFGNVPPSGPYVDPFLHPPPMGGIGSYGGGGRPPSFGGGNGSPSPYGGGSGPYARPPTVDSYGGPSGRRHESGGGVGGDYFAGSGGGGSVSAARYYEMERGGGHVSYGRHSPYPPGGPKSEQVSPQSKMSRSQAWSSYSSTGYPMSTAAGGPANMMFTDSSSGAAFPWDVAAAQHGLSATARSLTPQQQMMQQHRAATQGGGAAQGSAATNQATASMGALNLNSLMNPNILAAAAQACLIAAASGAGGTAGTDFSALLSNLQMSQVNSAAGGASAAQQQNAGSVTSQPSWWPSGAGGSGSAANGGNNGVAASGVGNGSKTAADNAVGGGKGGSSAASGAGPTSGSASGDPYREETWR